MADTDELAQFQDNCTAWKSFGHFENTTKVLKN